MGRLTKRIKFPDGGGTVDFANGKIEFLTDHTAGVRALFEELARYEDLADAGRLMLLPCKPGEWVYCIEDYYDEAEVSGYLFLATCGQYVIVCVGIYDLDESFDEQLEEMAEETQLGDDVGVKIFHMSKVFKTPEEAHEAIEGVE